MTSTDSGIAVTPPERSPADQPGSLLGDIGNLLLAPGRLLARVMLIVGGPLSVLFGVAVIASLLFVIVALRGGAKADFQLLAAVAVFAAYVEVPRMLVRLVLIAQLQTLRVETSAAALLDL